MFNEFNENPHRFMGKPLNFLQDGPPKIAFSCHVIKWLKMVDITIADGSYVMVYKPTFTYLVGPILYIFKCSKESSRSKVNLRNSAPSREVWRSGANRCCALLLGAPKAPKHGFFGLMAMARFCVHLCMSVYV